MRSELHERLAALHMQLEQTQSVDPQSRELLLALMADIARLLGGPDTAGEQAGEEEGVTQRLDELAVQFEAEHPSLGTAIRQLVDTLGKAGI